MTKEKQLKDKIRKVMRDTLTAYQYGYDEINEIAFEKVKADKDGIKKIECDTKFNRDMKKNRQLAIDFAVSKLSQLYVDIAKAIIKKSGGK